MASGTLINNTGDIVMNNDQKNTITLSTNQTYVNSNIILNTLVTKAVLNTDVNDTDHKTFTIQIPNGTSTDITLTFSVDTNGNVTVT